MHLPLRTLFPAKGIVNNSWFQHTLQYGLCLLLLAFATLGRAIPPLPNTDHTCCELTLQNTIHCSNQIKYAIYLKQSDGHEAYFQLDSYSWEVCQSEIVFKGQALKNMAIDYGESPEILTFEFYLKGQNNQAPTGSPKGNHCTEINPTDWLYYEQLTGTIASNVHGSMAVSRRGPAFQIGENANQTSVGFGGCGWFNLAGGDGFYLNGDINILFNSWCHEMANLEDGQYHLLTHQGGPLSFEKPSQKGSPLQQLPNSSTPLIEYRIVPLSDGHYQILNQEHQWVLDASGASTQPGTKVIQWSWHGGNNQKWDIEKIDDHRYLIKNVHNGLYLTSKPDDNAVLTLQPYQGSKSQQFQLTPAFSSVPLEKDFCQAIIYAAHSGKVWDIQGASQANGTPLIQYRKHGNKNQQFKIEHVSDGYHRIQVIHSQKYLTLQDNGKVVQSNWEHRLSQKWYIFQLPNGKYQLKNAQNHQFIEVFQSQHKNLAAIITNHHTLALNQQFEIEEIGCQSPLEHPGEITGPTTSCGPIQPVYKGTIATGGNGGTIEYQWQWRQPGKNWRNSNHASAKSQNWTPHTQYQNREFRRLARRSFSKEWLISNIITLQIIKPDQSLFTIEIDGQTQQISSKNTIKACPLQRLSISIDNISQSVTWQMPNGHATQSPTLEIPQITMAHNGTLDVDYINEQGCAINQQFQIQVMDPPSVRVMTSPSLCNERNGAIIFEFEDHPDRSHISFSKNGGQHFNLRVEDHQKLAKFERLSPGSYHVMVQWGNRECPIDLGVVTIENEALGYCCADWPNPGKRVCKYRSIKNPVLCPNNKAYVFALKEGNQTRYFKHRWGYFREYQNGTAILRSRVSEIGAPNNQFDLHLTFSERDYNHLELHPERYQCAAIPTLGDQYAYRKFHGVLKGIHQLSGICLDLNQSGAPFLLGTGISPLNTNAGLFGGYTSIDASLNVQSEDFHFPNDQVIDFSLQLSGNSCTNCHEKIDFKLTTSDKNACVGNTVSLQTDIQNGYGPFQYTWNHELPSMPSHQLLPSQTKNYRVSITDRLGCTKSKQLRINVEDSPEVDWEVVPSVCQTNNGDIIFYFEDHPDRSNIEFSLDGGLTFEKAVKDDQGWAHYYNLAPGEYHMLTRWGNNECPVDLGKAVIEAVDQDHCCEPLFKPGQTTCAKRTIDNSQPCGTENPHMLYLQINGQDKYYALQSGSFVEYKNGSARLQGTVIHPEIPMERFELDVIFTGRTWKPGPGSPHANGCFQNLISDDFYYYPYFSGYLTGRGRFQGACIKLDKMGPAFQIGSGANIAHQHPDDFGGSGWFQTTVLQHPIDGPEIEVPTGDINILLSGDACACNRDLQVRINTNQNNICPGESVNLEVAAQGGKAPYSFTWNQELPSSAYQTVFPETSIRYRLTLTDQAGCTRRTQKLIRVHEIPQIEMIADPATCDQPNGAITFQFDNNDSRTHLVFSIDGGANYQEKVSDASKWVTYDGLRAGDYPIYVKWGNGDCPNKLGHVKIPDIPLDHCCEPLVPPLETTCAERTVTTPMATCQSDLASTITLNINHEEHHFFIEEGTLNEYTNGEAFLRADLVSHQNNRFRFQLNWKLLKKTITPNKTIGQLLECQENTSIPDLYHYQSGIGQLIGKGELTGGCWAISSMGHLYLGTGLNTLSQPATFGAFAAIQIETKNFPIHFPKLNLSGQSLSVNLSGDACACNSNLAIKVKTPAGNALCVGESAMLEVQVDGGFPPYQYLWNHDLQPIANPEITPSQSTTYRLTVTDVQGCQQVARKHIKVHDLPEAYYHTNNPECGEKNGTITLFFEDHPSRSHLAFSLDGGKTYFPKVPDHTKSVTYSKLGAGTYPLFVRWGNKDCPKYLGTAVFDKSHCVTIGNYIWEDLNANGIQEESEPGIPNTWVLLKNMNGKTLRYTKSNEQGNYLFEDLEPQPFQIQFLTGSEWLTAPFKTGQNEDIDCNLDPGSNLIMTGKVAAGTSDYSFDAGFYLPGTIQGIAWLDLNEDGIRQETEAIVPNTVVYLYNESHQRLAATETDFLGRYAFNKLNPGYYYIGIVPPNGYAITEYQFAALASLDNDIMPNEFQSAIIEVTSGKQVEHLDIGFLNPCNLPTLTLTNNLSATRYLCEEASVWLDLQYQSDLSASLPEGYAIRYLLTFGEDQTIQMMADQPAFTILKTGAIEGAIHTLVYQEIPSNINYFDIQQIELGKTTLYSLSEVLSTNYDCHQLQVNQSYFSFMECPMLGNMVFEDLNRNGIHDPGEPGMPGITMQLKSSTTNAVIQEAITSVHGSYYFEDRPGDYIIEILPPSPYSLSTPYQGDDPAIDSDFNPLNNQTAVINIAANQYDLDIDAGLSIGCGLSACQLTLDQPNVQYICEIENETLSATPYGGSALPAGYEVLYIISEGTGLLVEKVSPTPSFTINKPQPGTCHMHCFAYNSDPMSPDYFDISTIKILETTLFDLESAIQQRGLCADIDMVGTEITFIACGSVGDQAFIDHNANGIKEGNENGFVDMEVQLLDPQTQMVFQTTRTNETGNFSFFVRPGNYILQFNPPSEWIASPPHVGDDHEIDSDIAPQSNQTSTIAIHENTFIHDLDAGFFQFASVGNYVWEDLNADGIQTEDEPGLPNIGVYLLNEYEKELAYTETDAQGEYIFSRLSPGNYKIKFINDDDYHISPKNNGIDPLIDSDPGHASGLTNTFSLSTGQHKMDIDAGLYLLVSCEFEYHTERITPEFTYICETTEQEIPIEAQIDEQAILPRGFQAEFILTTGTQHRILQRSPNPSFSLSRTSFGVYHIFTLIRQTDPNSAFYLPVERFIGTNTTIEDLQSLLLTQTDCWSLPDTGIPFQISACGFIGGEVFIDTNGDGVQNESQEDASGITIHLIDATTQTIWESLTTPSNGQFAFIVRFGNYQLSAQFPDHYSLSPVNQGTEALDSDIFPESGQTAIIPLPNENSSTFNQGIGLIPFSGLIAPNREHSENLAVNKPNSNNPVLHITENTPISTLPQHHTALQYWPNPFDQHIDIRLNVLKPGMFNISITDLSGKVLKKWPSQYLEMGPHHWTIQTPDWPTGMYIISWESSSSTGSKKIIKQ